MSNTLTLKRENILYEWVRLLFGLLKREGLEHAVICPGSRNAPLIYGALAESSLKCHSVIDERSAGFFALGLARATGVPVALICTSGTALAHFLPAVIEAHHSSVPLLILSADRPEYLQNCGAPQTIGQMGIFGSFAHAGSDWIEPSDDPQQLAQFADTLTQLFRKTLGPNPGPAHLNLPFDKPLEPAVAAHPHECRAHQIVDRLLNDHQSKNRDPHHLDHTALTALLRAFMDSEGQHIVSLGPVEPAIVSRGAEFARSVRCPLLCELPDAPSSMGVDALARRFLSADCNEKLNIIHLGPPMISSPWANLLQADHVQHWVVSGPRYLDPSKSAQLVFQSDLEGAITSLIEQSKQSKQLTSAQVMPIGKEIDDDEAGAKSVNAALRALEEQLPSGRMAEPLAVLEVLNAAHEAQQFLLGNSLSVRLAAWVKDAAVSKTRAFFTSRGTNGIDGLIAQGAGLACAFGRSTVVLLGDVAAAHDLGSLALVRSSLSPLVVVVLENEGGMIFQHLPGASMWDRIPEARDFFITPPAIDWQAAGQTYGIPVWDCSRLEQLSAAVEITCQRAGPSLVIARTDSSTTRTFLRQLHGEAPG